MCEGGGSASWRSWRCIASLAPAAGTARAREIVVTSFDGTPIAASFYPAATVPGQAPTILRTHGFGRRRDRAGTPHGPVDHFVQAGYNVLTWDSRGFGESGGTSMLNDPAYEGADVRRLLDVVAAQPEALLDGAGDPRAGMTGGSYAGDIQLVAAALDPRIDVISPAYAWSSLLDSLYPRGALKSGWYDALADLARPPDGGTVDSRFVGFWQEATLGAAVTPANHDFLAAADRSALVAAIRAPTLLRAGTPDTLFTPSQAIASYTILRDRGVPVKMIWDCAGHGACLAGEGEDPGHSAAVEDAWLARWLKRDLDVDVGAGFEWLADDRVWRSAPAWPVGPGGELVATGAGVMDIVPGHGPGPSPAHVAIGVPPSDTELAGAPLLELTYSGSATIADTWVYAQISDAARGQVLGNQATPVPVRLDGAAAQRHGVARGDRRASDAGLAPAARHRRRHGHLRRATGSGADRDDVHPRAAPRVRPHARGAREPGRSAGRRSADRGRPAAGGGRRRRSSRTGSARPRPSRSRGSFGGSSRACRERAPAAGSAPAAPRRSGGAGAAACRGGADRVSAR